MNQDIQNQALKVILHAPTPAALERARKNAVNLLRDAPDTELRIVLNAEAVEAALDQAHADVDAHTWVCPTTLTRIGRENRPPLQVMAGPAVVEIARMQRAGWVYIRS
ncbi:hypothetical protein QRD40_05830 [Comamonas sp. Y6]|uniref:Intracellular sulfur oxidation DsrE/DsrF family protein n=1 Tax=Comamonas resistens TaxID=3046670 RepID=A0ABY8SQD3_9BURK|nr:hypothetical protein [Comamonas resistens]MDL5035866.1 hypothetical protein [Comamonas resistens]WHS65272.1 hypothetical protein QMY55_22795 [Comamonas resistens]HBP0978936.1 hypothetical protein [Pseudomonas aeruginosa]